MCLNKKETGTNMPISLKLDNHLNNLGYYLLEGYLLFPTIPRNVGSITSVNGHEHFNKRLTNWLCTKSFEVHGQWSIPVPVEILMNTLKVMYWRKPPANKAGIKSLISIILADLLPVHLQFAVLFSAEIIFFIFFTSNIYLHWKLLAYIHSNLFYVC